MMLTVPFTDDPFQSFRCSFRGVEYVFSADYNSRSGVWSFGMADSITQAPIVSGVPILLGCDLLAPYGLGIGSMFAVDLAASPSPALIGTTGVVGPVVQATDAGPDDLGARVRVIYIEPGEVIP